MNVAIALEGRHRAAQPVGLLRGKAGTDDRDLHRLLLKQRHAHGFAQHLAQRVGGVVDRLDPGTPAQIRVHHVALDRAGPDDRDLDHEVVEFARAQARQHRHLGSAFDLKTPSELAHDSIS